MNKNRIYLSGPITGTSDYMERFAAAESRLTEEGWMVYNPAKVNAQMPEGTSYEEYMEVSFLLLGMADAIYMMHGWENSLGANRECTKACADGKCIIYEQKS